MAWTYLPVTAGYSVNHLVADELWLACQERYGSLPTMPRPAAGQSLTGGWVWSMRTLITSHLKPPWTFYYRVGTDPPTPETMLRLVPYAPGPNEINIFQVALGADTWQAPVDLNRPARPDAINELYHVIRALDLRELWSASPFQSPYKRRGRWTEVYHGSPTETLEALDAVAWSEWIDVQGSSTYLHLVELELPLPALPSAFQETCRLRVKPPPAPWTPVWYRVGLGAWTGNGHPDALHWPINRDLPVRMLALDETTELDRVVLPAGWPVDTLVSVFMALGGESEAILTVDDDLDASSSGIDTLEYMWYTPFEILRVSLEGVVCDSSAMVYQ